ncbi:ionotropic receptor 75a-like isoform X2 [Athalia rosae]|uniref:ionotropic receptor 75a-like isoform X2 n=1 Tax=Athalia rosae TaxID=37344 RepID=UPI000A0EDDD7|nr:ionotropic receptor 75a-like isoform X2 [Athalia rosae]XP_048511098.1 ionotropic receptor 75a-like isoform X2 [Athalia rosae]XP_048511099.1 ionotropic receptor 75a-like isoform X2 [Athalia rosae]XP_048511100.1 ionotropic receptor 75a-like isoform X2 [Athalia rosae]
MIEQINFHHWSMASKSKVSYIPLPTNGILDMQKMLTVNYYKLGILLTIDCPESNLVLKEFTRQALPYNQTYQWLLVTEHDSLPIAILRDLPLTIDTEMTFAIRNGLHYVLHDVYNPSYRHGGSLNITPMGKWNNSSGLDINLTQYKYQRRGNLNGLIINVSLAITHDPTPDFETYITTPVNRHFDTMHRYHFALIRHLREYYNFTMNLMRTDSWGYLINGTFNGMLGEMVAGRVDIGATPLIFREERINVAEFTVQTYVARACFIFRHPKKSTVRNGFLKPFTEEVWYATVIIALVNWILLYLTARVEIRLQTNASPSTLNTLPASETALITVAALCQQGLSDGPHLYSGRVVFFTLFLWALLLFQYYSASIVGSLLAEPPRYIRTLKDLLESDMPVGIEDIAYNYNHFATTTDEVALELHRRKIAPGKGRKRAAYFNVTDGLRRLQKGNFAFHVDVATAYKFITDEFEEDEICDLVEIQLFPQHHLGTVTSKHSPFKKMVTYGMRQIIEHGVAERLKHVWQYRRPRCPVSHSLNPVQVSIGEFSPALFLLLMGLMSAATVCLGEYHIRRQGMVQKYTQMLGCTTYQNSNL